MIKVFFKFVRIDIFRAFFSFRFFVSIFGVCLCMCLATLEDIGWNISVLYVFHAIAYGMTFLLTTICCAMPYSTGIAEDTENNYFHLLIIRGYNVKCYTLAKCITIILSAIVTMIVGTLCFIMLVKIKLPWIAGSDSTYETLSIAGGLRCFLLSENFILYYLLFALQYGILAAILALLSALISLYINDKLLILTIPLISFYIISFYANAIFKNNIADLYNIFNASINIWNNDLLSFLYAIGIGSVSSVILIFLINRKLERGFKLK